MKAIQKQKAILRKKNKNFPGQIEETKEQLEIHKIVQVSTVDSFQGREKDTIIISLVRVSKKTGGSIGFLSDFRRMNVAITRAQNFLWVVGHALTLNSNKNWGDFIRFCFHKRCARTYATESAIKGMDIIRDTVPRTSKEFLKVWKSSSSNSGGDEIQNIEKPLEEMKNSSYHLKKPFYKHKKANKRKFDSRKMKNKPKKSKKNKKGMKKEVIEIVDDDRFESGSLTNVFPED